MSVYKAQTLVKTFPAYNIYEREADSSGFVNLTADEDLILYIDGDYKYTYNISSVVSYALSYNEDPMKAVERAKSFGNPLHWINQNAIGITSSKAEPKTMIHVELGMQIRFEGVLFTIEKAPNDNLKLVELEA